MTVDLSKAVEQVIQEQDKAREMLVEDLSEDNAREFLIEKVHEEFSGNLGDTVIEAELKSQIKNL